MEVFKDEDSHWEFELSALLKHSYCLVKMLRATWLVILFAGPDRISDNVDRKVPFRMFR